MDSGECFMQSIISNIHAFPVAAQTYKEYLGGVDWVLTSEVVIAGIVIVMLVLLLLILIFKGFGKAVSKGGKADQKNNVDVPQAPAPAAQSVPAAPAVQSGISGEVVAAIAAAIYAAEGGKQVVIRSIRVKNVSGRNPWAAAAIADNTRPF